MMDKYLNEIKQRLNAISNYLRISGELVAELHLEIETCQDLLEAQRKRHAKDNAKSAT